MQLKTLGEDKYDILSVLMKKIIVKINPYGLDFTGYVTVTFLNNFFFFPEPEQAGVRPGQSTAEEDGAGHRALHNQCEWGFTTTGFLFHHCVVFEFLTSSRHLTVTSSSHAMI